MAISNDAAAVRVALQAFLDRYLSVCEQVPGGLPVCEHDPGWRSVCEVGEPDGAGKIAWRPVRREPPGSLARLSEALELLLHPAVEAFYTAYWCAPVQARVDEGALTLIQIWNAEDFDRLAENIVGHVLAKRRARLPPTVFIAPTDEAELMLSVDNASGEVVLENPGARPVEVVDASLAAFLNRLQPLAEPPPGAS